MMTRSHSTMIMLVAVGLVAVPFLTSGCGPVIFKLDETRTMGACPWTDDESEIECVSFRTNREPLQFGYRDGPSQCSNQTIRSANLRSI